MENRYNDMSKWFLWGISMKNIFEIISYNFFFKSQLVLKKWEEFLLSTFGFVGIIFSLHEFCMQWYVIGYICTSA